MTVAYTNNPLIGNAYEASRLGGRLTLDYNNLLRTEALRRQLLNSGIKMSKDGVFQGDMSNHDGAYYQAFRGGQANALDRGFGSSGAMAAGARYRPIADLKIGAVSAWETGALGRLGDLVNRRRDLINAAAADASSESAAANFPGPGANVDAEYAKAKQQYGQSLYTDRPKKRGVR